ncbi:MAG: thiosulfate oxidation carrier complex protein SoxZ [Dongiaceae bacterium]
MTMPEPRVRVPSMATTGEIVEIKALVTHQMESGLRRDGAGTLMPRKIINAFSCRYNGEVVFSVDLHEAVAANPYLEFHVRAGESGTLEFAWHEDGGAVYKTSETLTVT